MRFVSRGLALSLVVAPSLLAAQGAQPPQNNVLTIYREIIKTGKGPAHASMETAWSWANLQAKAPAYIAATVISGPNEVWYISAYPTWADYQKGNDSTNMTPALS